LSNDFVQLLLYFILRLKLDLHSLLLVLAIYSIIVQTDGVGIHR
jgi:hypothetical protein